MDCSTPGFPIHLTNSWSLLKLMSIESVMPSNHLILCHPHLLLPSIFTSIRVFSIESALHIKWPTYWSFSFSICLSSEYSGLISFQIGSDQLLSRVRLFATPWITVRQASLPITNSRSSPKLCPSSQWCHPAISSSVIPFSSCPQSLPASKSFPMSQLFAWGGQSTGVSALASFLPKKSQGWSPSEWTGWISLQSKVTLESLLQHHSSKASILWRSAFFTVQLSLPYMTTGKTIALTRWTIVGKVMSLLFNMLSRLVITFLPRSKHLLVSWLQSTSAVILEPKK